MNNKRYLIIAAITVSALTLSWFYETIRIYAAIILCLLLLDLVWKKLFCRGKKKEDGTIVFNLSTGAEWLRITYMTGLAVLGIYFLYAETPVWYEWIFPCIYITLFMGKIVEIKANMQDSITIGKDFMYWVDNKEAKTVKPASFNFTLDKSEALGLGLIGTNLGWHLIVKDDAGVIHSLDLKTMNLHGHKRAIAKILELRNISVDKELKIIQAKPEQ